MSKYEDYWEARTLILSCYGDDDIGPSKEEFIEALGAISMYPLLKEAFNCGVDFNREAFFARDKEVFKIFESLSNDLQFLYNNSPGIEEKVHTINQGNYPSLKFLIDTLEREVDLMPRGLNEEKDDE